MKQGLGNTGLAILLAVGPLVGMAGSGRAEDYPYSGAYAPSDEALTGETLARRCALSFVEQRANGDWFIYHVDLDAFRTDRTIRFYQASNGHCDFDAARNVETCVTFVDIAYPAGEGEILYDVATSIGADRVTTAFFDDATELDTALADPALLTQAVQQNFDRCPVPIETLSTLIAPGLSPATQDTINSLRFPDPSLLADPLVDLLAKRLQEM